MFDILPSELLVVALVALICIPPKDLPHAMRTLGRIVGKARGMARQFRSHFDEMVREAELEEMEKKWRAENERIMREHAVDLNTPAPPPPAASIEAATEMPAAVHAPVEGAAAPRAAVDEVVTKS